jgi:DnaK suppressor protein
MAVKGSEGFKKKDLDAFKKTLEEKKSELIQLLQKSKSSGREIDSESEAMDIVDKASSSYTKEFLFSRSNQERLFILAIEEALARIEDGSFGECSNCGESVNRKRLEAVPWAKLCLACQELEEQGRLED